MREQSDSGRAASAAGTGAGRHAVRLLGSDAEGAVDAEFRSYVTHAYASGDEAKARKVLETDGFACRDGNRPDGHPVPQLECERIYAFEDDVHAWTVEFWANEARPRAHYARTHIRDTTKYYKEKRG